MSEYPSHNASPRPATPSTKPQEWKPAPAPSPFPDVALPPRPQDANETLLRRLRDFAERHGMSASQPQLASERTRFDPLALVESHLQQRGMVVTRNAELDGNRYDLLATTTINGSPFTLGLQITFERGIALDQDAIAITVRRQHIFQDCVWVKNNIDTIVKGLATARSYTERK